MYIGDNITSNGIYIYTSIRKWTNTSTSIDIICPSCSWIDKWSSIFHIYHSTSNEADNRSCKIWCNNIDHSIHTSCIPWSIDIDVSNNIGSSSIHIQWTTIIWTNRSCPIHCITPSRSIIYKHTTLCHVYSSTSYTCHHRCCRVYSKARICWWICNFTCSIVCSGKEDSSWTVYIVASIIGIDCIYIGKYTSCSEITHCNIYIITCPWLVYSNEWCSNNGFWVYSCDRNSAYSCWIFRIS